MRIFLFIVILTVVTGNHIAALSTDEVVSLITEAASISPQELTKVMENKPLDEQEMPLSLLLLCLNPKLEKQVNAQVYKDFNYITPNIRNIFLAMNWKDGRASLIQPKYIIKCSIKRENNTAQGEFSFKIGNLCQGLIQFNARQLEKKWSIIKFTLPNYGLQLRQAQNHWQIHFLPNRPIVLNVKKEKKINISHWLDEDSSLNLDRDKLSKTLATIAQRNVEKDSSRVLAVIHAQDCSWDAVKDVMILCAQNKIYKLHFMYGQKITKNYLPIDRGIAFAPIKPGGIIALNIIKANDEIIFKINNTAFKGKKENKALSAKLATLIQKDPQANIILWADNKVPFSKVAVVVDICSRTIRKHRAKNFIKFSNTPVMEELAVGEFVEEKPFENEDPIEDPVVKDPVVKDVMVKEHNETMSDIDLRDAISDSPFEGGFQNDAIGIGGGSGGKFGGRLGGRKNLVKRGGGNAKTENAVKIGLEWLKRHQNEDGSWSNNNRRCGLDAKYPGSCWSEGGKWSKPGLSGLALLCFLGAGNSVSNGQYRSTVKQTVRYLKSIQDDDGCFGERMGHYMYNHTIATLAMCEAYSLSNYNPLLKSSAQRSVDFLVRAQNPNLGWRYSSQSGDNDTSVSSWGVMALKAAKEAELEVPESCFKGANNWLDSVTDENYYRSGYIQKGDMGARLQGATGKFTNNEAMTAAAMTMRIFMGCKRTDRRLMGGSGLLLSSPPEWGKNTEGKSTVDFYYWYYGTLAMYQVGGEYWKGWNRKIKTALVDNQNTTKKCHHGSWDPVDPWGKAGGRLYSTALNILSLEIYYRYAKVFK